MDFAFKDSIGNHKERVPDDRNAVKAKPPGCTAEPLENPWKGLDKGILMYPMGFLSLVEPECQKKVYVHSAKVYHTS